MSSSLLAISLVAVVGNSPIWELKLESRSASACMLAQVGRAALPISKSECEEARRLLQGTEALVSSPGFKPEAEVSVFDEPAYRMTISGKAFPVRFEAPEECRLLSDGSEWKERCRKNALSPQQKLLLLLRPKAKR